MLKPLPKLTFSSEPDQSFITALITSARIIFLVILAVIFSGCTLINGIDSKFPRQVIPLNEVFVVELQYNDADVIKKEIRCEKYYDAMPSVRGNFWAVREVGYQSQYETSKIEIIDTDIGTIVFTMPTCGALIEKKSVPLNHLPLTIKGKPFWLKSSDGNKHNYFRPAMHNNGINESLTLNFVLKIDGIIVK